MSPVQIVSSIASPFDSSVAWFLAVALLFVILSAVQSCILCEFLHPLSLLTSLCIIYLTSFYGCGCFRHKYIVKKKISTSKHVLVLLLEFFFFMGRTGALDCASCNRQQLVGAWISPLAPPGAKSSQQHRRAPLRPAWLIIDGETGGESLTANRDDEERVQQLIDCEGFILNQAASRPSQQNRTVLLAFLWLHWLLCIVYLSDVKEKFEFIAMCV